MQARSDPSLCLSADAKLTPASFLPIIGKETYVLAPSRTENAGGKLGIRGLFRLNYESQIRISLVFFIIFLILLNFGTEYLFHHAKRALRNQTYQQLSTVAQSAHLIWEKSPQPDLRKSLLELAYNSGVSRISFLSSEGQPLISSKDVRSTEDHHVFWGVNPEAIGRLRAADQRQNQGIFFSDFYPDSGGNTYLSCYSPLRQDATNGPIWIMVEKEVSTFASIEKISRLNALARIIGLIVAAFVTLLLIRNLLRPYRIMVKRAETEKLIPKSGEDGRDGDLDAAVGIFERVIDELKQKEKALEELYRKTDRKAKDLASYNEYILKSMTCGMIICDENGKIRRMNQPAKEILRLSESLVLGNHYEKAFANGHPLRSAIQTAFAEGGSLSVPETKLEDGPGWSVPLSLSASAVKDEEDRMLGVVVFITDLTEIRELEEEVAFKDKMATLGEMSSGLAHELRNSMGAILGFVKLLRREKRPASQNQTVDSIFSEAMSMESMLQRFLAFAKPYQLQIDRVDLGEIIRESHSSVQELLKEKNITFALHSQPDVGPTPGDALLLKQCIQNLIQNSIEAMPDGGRLTVSLDRDKPASGEERVTIEVSDTGCGIPDEVQSRIFNPFFTTKEKGTGLGLSLVKKIISLHNGKIDVDSKPGKGTRFTIHLPLAPEPHLTETEMPRSEALEISV